MRNLGDFTAFRNKEQAQAFNKWWREYMRQYFPDIAKSVEGNEDAIFAIHATFKQGVTAQSRLIQEALGFDTATETYPYSK